MAVTQEMLENVLVFRLAGRLDSANSRELEQLVMASIAEGHRRVVIDFSLLEYISSAGLRVILVAGKRLGEQDSGFALAGMRQSVSDVFRMSGFLALFAIYPTATEAAEALR